MKVLLIKELKSNWRSFRYPGFLLVVLFFALLDPPMLIYMSEFIGYFSEGIEVIIPDPTPGEVFASYLSDVSQIGILVLIFMVMGSVAREKETGVTGWLLSKPVSRRDYLLAKLAALYAVIVAGIFSCSILAYLYTASLLGAPLLAEAAWATGALVVFTIFMATITFALSTVMKSPLQAGGLAVVIFFLGGILNMFISGSAAARFYPNSLLTYFRPLLEGTAEAADIAWPAAVTLAVTALVAILAGLRFSRLEL